MENVQNRCEVVILAFLSKHGEASIHTLRRICMEEVANCKAEDINAAVVDMLSMGDITARKCMFAIDGFGSFAVTTPIGDNHA